MKFNQKKAIEIATTGGSAVVGTKISKAANTVIPASIKNPAVHGVIAIAAFIGASMISGTGMGAQVGRGLAIGVGIDQGNTAINDVVAPMLPANDGSKKALFLDAAFKQEGLGSYRGLNAPFSPGVMQSLNTMQEVDNGPIRINVAG